jgi:polysaccharide deacetylase family protein (PEP-CTERM system associated)
VWGRNAAAAKEKECRVTHLVVAASRPTAEPAAQGLQLVLSFDVEEHHHIEAAAGLALAPAVQAQYSARVAPATHWLLDQLAQRHLRATFFVVGQLALAQPELVRAIHRAGHEVASHGWDHQRLHHLTPASFRDDLRRSKDALEQITGAPVHGFRAPTFSVVRQTAWSIDVLAELGFAYDSSIYPVVHDRYGVPRAPRWPFRAQGLRHGVLELPLATWRVLGVNLPLGGGGSFRLFPLAFLERAIRQAARQGQPAVAVLYFHPWEFDPEQPRLPLRCLGRFRTYVGLGRSRQRLQALLGRHRFTRAIDAVRVLQREGAELPAFRLAERGPGLAPVGPALGSEASS